MDLYPLKFKPILKERIWGGTKLFSRFGKDLHGKENIGESWEISGVDGDVSEVVNGDLAGNNLQELIGIYMDNIVGEKIFEKYGTHFPLLIKFLDANDDLSIQVHPDDAMAQKRLEPNGKTEMWVALDDEASPKLVAGFNKTTNREEFLEKLEEGSLTEILNYEDVKKGDVFFVPAGRVHSICSGNLIAEIQQTSDVTYRIYDYDRKDKDGNKRELHLKDALDVMDYTKADQPKVKYIPAKNQAVELVQCSYFTTNLLDLDHTVERDIYAFDSFVILICTEGNCLVGKDEKDATNLKAGETVLIPAAMHSVKYQPLGEGVKLIEVYIR